MVDLIDPIYEISGVIEELTDISMRLRRYPKRQKSLNSFINRLTNVIENLEPFRFYHFWRASEEIIVNTLELDSEIDGIILTIPFYSKPCLNPTFYNFSDRFIHPEKREHGKELF